MGSVALVSSFAVLAFITKAGATSRFNDFYTEVWPAYAALSHGHLLAALRLSPAYVGSLVLRAPFAMIPTIWGGGPRAVFFAAAVPCMLALAAFCVWLAEQPRKRGRTSAASRLSPIVLCILSPVIIIGLGDGHPEELLGGVLCVAAVVCAAEKRPRLAGLLITLAVINKSWALVAVPVVLVVLPTISRRAVALLAGAAALIVLMVIAADSHGVNALSLTGQIGSIFNPPQLLWVFGPHAWISQKSRALVLILAVACSVAWRIQRSHMSERPSAVPDALLLLTLVLFIRAAFDPWNNLYYHEPFLFALIAYEATSGRAPVLMTLYSLLLLIVVPLKSYPPMSFDERAVAYAAVAIPTLLWLTVRVYAPTIDWTRLLPWRGQRRRQRLRADNAAA